MDYVAFGATDDEPSRPLLSDPDWADGSLYEDVRQRHTSADSVTVWRAIETATSDSEWSAVPWGRSLRGWANSHSSDASRNIGVMPHSRGHRRLREGESLDWWRVEHIEEPHLLRLRAEVSLPGRLWLELSAHPDGDGGSVFRQRALFQPFGLGGQFFWKGLMPVRKALVGGIARDIIAVAELQSDLLEDVARELIASER